MAGLDPSVRVLTAAQERGCPGPGYAKATPGTRSRAGEASAKTASAGMTPPHVETVERVKLLRGQGLPDMRGLRGKFAENCRYARLDRAKFVNFCGIGPKFLAVQR